MTLHLNEAPDRWRAFARPAKRLKLGDRIDFDGGLQAEVAAKGEAGEVTLVFPVGGGDLLRALESAGEMPLPPYISRPDGATKTDAEDYQTVYATRDGAVAAPTAGLHFTPELFAALKATPEVSAVMVRQAAVDAFYETIGRNILVYIFMFTGFAGALAFGVTYNSVRIALSERGRELATLRVLGFTRGEISYILLSEVALLIFVALPLGCLFGHGLSLVIAVTFDTELFRMPFAISASTYGLGVAFAILASTASALLVRRRIVHLDLIGVLKTRE